MKLLTKKSAEKVRYFDLGDDAGFWGRLLTVTEIRDIRHEARSEAGTDDTHAEHLFMVKYLQKSLSNWKGFVDEEDGVIPFSTAVIPDLFEVNPKAMGMVFLMDSSEFHHLAQVSEKNSGTGAEEA